MIWRILLALLLPSLTWGKKPARRAIIGTTIWDVVSKGQSFSEFRKLASSCPDIEKILSNGDKKVTLFAPTNVAVTNRGRIVDSARLKSMLLYHIGQGIIKKEVIDASSITEISTYLVDDVSPHTRMPEGSPQMIAIHEGKLSSGIYPDAKILTKATECSNGVIYSIDVLMIPPHEIPQGVEETPFNEMLGYIKEDVMNREGLTMFVPPLRAFQAASRKVDASVLTWRHTIKGVPMYLGDLKDGRSFKAMDGTTLRVSVKGGKVTINGRRILAGNIMTNFGVIHMVDGGINPVTTSASRPAKPADGDVSVEYDEEENKGRAKEKMAPRAPASENRKASERGFASGSVNGSVNGSYQLNPLAALLFALSASLMVVIL